MRMRHLVAASPLRGLKFFHTQVSSSLYPHTSIGFLSGSRSLPDQDKSLRIVLLQSAYATCLSQPAFRDLGLFQILRLILIQMCMSRLVAASAFGSLRFFKIRFGASVDPMVASCHICLLRICDMIAGSSTCSVIHILGTLRYSKTLHHQISLLAPAPGEGTTFLRMFTAVMGKSRPSIKTP